MKKEQKKVLSVTMMTCVLFLLAVIATSITPPSWDMYLILGAIVVSIVLMLPTKINMFGAIVIGGCIGATSCYLVYTIWPIAFYPHQNSTGWCALSLMILTGAYFGWRYVSLQKRPR